MRIIRTAANMIVDFMLTIISIYLAMLLRFEGAIPEEYFAMFTQYGWILAIIAIVIFFSLGMYNNMWKYASIYELGLIFVCVFVYSISARVFFIFVPENLPRSIYILSGLLLLGMVCCARLTLRAYASWRMWGFFGKARSNILIIGAGQAASMVIKELFDHPELGRPVVVIDEDSSKWGMRVHGIRVIGGMKELPYAVSSCKIDEILIAMPSAPEERIRAILNQCKETGCRLKRLPGIYKIIDGKITMQQVRNVNIDDLLGRPEVHLSVRSISDYLNDQVILVTGAGGSIGSELCRQISCFNPKLLVLMDIYENNLYELQLELDHLKPDLNKIALVGSIRDKERLNDIFSTYRPDVVFHAAAHKHVHLMEGSPGEAIKNNLLGTINVAEAAEKYNIQKFILISTDKAVNPTNVMGASKRLAEIAIQHINKRSKTQFASVRFGNVLGSSGSVIPIFQNQIARGGPVTVTHPDVTRYFMTIPEAAQLVIQAGAMAEGGEVFVLDMGEPVKIVHMAEDLIHLSGFRPNIDIKIEFTGLRPGEKMFEELNLRDELTEKTCHDKIFKCKPPESCNFVSEIRSLANIITKNTVKDIENILREIFPDIAS